MGLNENTQPVQPPPEAKKPAAPPVPPPELRKPLPHASYSIVPPDARKPVSHSAYSLVPAEVESIRPLTGRGASAITSLNPPSHHAFNPAYVAPVTASRVDLTQAARGQMRAVSQPMYRPASTGYVHPASAHPAPVPPARRPGDAERLMPWLRDISRPLRALTEAQCASIFKFASMHRVEANTVLQALDAPPTACFAITSGTIVVRVRRSNGALREVDRYGPGDIVGVLALVNAQPSPYEMVAATVVEAVAFEADELAQYAAALHPDAVAAQNAWAPIVVEQLRAVQQRVARLASAKRTRVANAIDDAWKGVK